MKSNFWRKVLPGIALVSGLIMPVGAQVPYQPAATPAAVPAPAAPVESPSDTDRVASSVVKIFTTAGYPDLYRPWSKQTPTELTGTGVVIDGNRILTCAHVVAYASQVQIQADQSADKIFATVEAIAPDIDLAILKLDDNSFFDTHHALPRAETMSKVADPVRVYGFPLGGDSLSITRGIISRIEFTSYNYPAEGLRIQIDAAVNPGNSGGPAVVNDKMIGIAFSRFTGDSAQNIGYIIPCDEIDLFLKEIASGSYTGKPIMMDQLQTLENSALRSSLKLDKSITGMVVRQPYDPDPAYPLKKWDVITKVGDVPVDDQGKITVDGDLRIAFQYEIQKVIKDGKVPLTVARNGKEIQVQLPVPIKPPLLVPYLNDQYPSYFIFGPLVFSESTQDYLTPGRASTAYNILGALGMAGSPLVTRMGDKPRFPGERLVIISSPFFPHHLAEGYSDPIGDVVKSVNGVAVKNLAHLVQLLRDSRDEFVSFEMEGKRGETLVFPRAEMLTATDEILEDNGIRSQGSPDIMAIWNAKSSGKADTTASSH
ncbi:MAG TPA: trypsin-like peptidase domain-containing protein [Verrucomicrobiae bacterium]|jgi:S1-C subfamily serine protease